ncbi:MAG: CapA family protein, partial [Myxococcales bacterium]|nr:CapA family protein [Myxococcales bacterium]
QSWTVGELLSWTTDRFRQVGIDEARVDAEHLLALALGCKRFDLYVQHARLLGEAERAPFRELVKRRLAREPVAYIAGTRGFHALDLDLAVDRRVLIPRPETEHLVDWLLEELPGRRRPAPPVDDLDEASDAEASEGDAAEASVELEPASVEPEAPAEPTPPVHVLEGYLRFAGACDPGTTVTIAAVGDVLLHQELQRQAYAAKERHLALWGGVVDLLKRADLTYANLEGPMAAGIDKNGDDVGDPGEVFDKVVYSAYPRFNFHPSVAVDLKRSGFDVVSTANNHALDRQAIGVDRTIDALRKAGLRYTGTRRSDEPDAAWHTVLRAGGLKIAFIACTDLLNVRPDAGGQVLRCRGKAFERELHKLVKTRGIDAVIVTPHWGKEYAPEPREREIDLAHRWAEAGATAILGSHPHVLQPWERYAAEDGREVLIHYSLGNFASHQPELPKRSTVLLYLGLRKGDDGSTRVVGARYLPLHVRQEGEEFFVEAIDRVGGPADARALIVDMYGPGNLLGADEPVEVAPHCDPAWRPAPAPTTDDGAA